MNGRMHRMLRMTTMGAGLLLVLVCGGGTAGAELQCFDCHGERSSRDIRPVDAPSRDPETGGTPGNHHAHLPPIAAASDCAVCHPGAERYTSGHRDGQVSISSRINRSPAATTYGNLSSFGHSSAPFLTSCNNVNCHFEKDTPSWGTSSLSRSACSTCHGAPPADGSHPATEGKGKKHGDYIGRDPLRCAVCHLDHTADADPLAHAREAGNRGLKVQFSVSPNSGGSYSGDVSYPRFLPSQHSDRNGTCTNLYCHSDGRGGPPTRNPAWSDPEGSGKCYSCHKGILANNTPADCTSIPGSRWDSIKGYCIPYINITTNGHSRLVGPQWIRKYPCHYCHSGTVTPAGAMNPGSHVNGTRDVVMAEQWNIVGRPASTYDPVTKNCNNVYCHSDGTTNPETVRPFSWNTHGTECNTCHGHPRGSCGSAGCHDGRVDGTGKTWVLGAAFGSRTSYRWPSGQEWKAAIPMFPNKGPGTARANSHPRHTETNFTCDQCHSATIVNGTCTDCHVSGIPAGNMGEVAHLNPEFHSNKAREVVFKRGGSYDPVAKTCSGTACHTGGIDPQWGGSVNGSVICLNCHGTTSADVDSFGFNIYSSQAKINLTQWVTTGHGRPSSAGPYPASGNPAANFPGNPCWYCHDNNVIHNDRSNPFRLRLHLQFTSRFDKECVFCHMVRSDAECLACHNASGSLAPQLTTLPAKGDARWPDGTAAPRPDHTGMIDGTTSCLTPSCHFIDPAFPTKDLKVHNVGAQQWTSSQKDDVRNQYVMMGVCLKCHDDDTGGKCTSCHTAPANNPLKFSLGFDPGTGWIKPQKARASSSHFGYKHYRSFMATGGWDAGGVWKGGKFCWDCHDPHGDANIYMIQNQVATSTEGTYGIPKTRAAVSFTQKQSGMDYARISAPYNGICNVCHTTGSQHYRADAGDGHNAGRVCTTCHEHRFTDSHANDQACTTCHRNRPVPRHSGFGLPRDCTKCHTGTIGMRMDIMGQFKGTSHHVQAADGVVTNKHCYACHWESTPEGLIDVRHHEGYNYKTYTTVQNAKVDLVVWKPGERPTYYNTTTSMTFTASMVGTAGERAEVTKISNHCLSCHSDQNNTTRPFDDCKTPRQYAWDGQSVAARYLQTGTTPWGKYNSTTYANANQKDRVAKAFSAHGNATANQGGFTVATGTDSSIPDTRGGSAGVQCFDCHSSHGSKLVGVTSSYVTFNGTLNGGNLKETQAGKGGYAMSYKASANTNAGSTNPYNAGAGQCFDCHLNQTGGTTPWGYQSTFGATAPILGYMDAPRFMSPGAGVMQRYTYKAGAGFTKGGHLKASSFLNHTTAAQNKINGLCTPCHDPHGVSPTLGSKQAYAVPLLKGTWLTSPYREDVAKESLANPPSGGPDSNPTTNVRTDQQTFGNVAVTEDDGTFAGLCLRCHYKKNLTDGVTHTWKSQDRVHESVKGWKTANGTIQHNYTCSKCHTPHSSGLPRLMITNCLDVKHRGRGPSGGQAGANSGQFQYAFSDPHTGSFPRGIDQSGVNCHPAGAWPDNSWNTKTPW